MGLRNLRKSKIRKILSTLKPNFNKNINKSEEKVEQTIASEDFEAKQNIDYKNQIFNKNIQRMPIPADLNFNITIKKDTLAKIRQIRDQYPIHSIKINNYPIHLSHATIQYNPNINQLSYFVTEPKLDARLEKIVKKTISELHDRLEIDFSELQEKKQVYKYIDEKINEIWKILGIKLSASDSLKIKYYIIRDAVGLNIIEPLIRDPNIEDISCDGIGLPLYIFHRNPTYNEMGTNIIFHKKEELDSFVMKLAQKCGRTISVSSPLMDGSLPDGSRVQITYGTDIARRGSNFTIRKFFHVPLTPIDLINFRTADPLTLAYLWLAIEKEKSILIAGTTATGKTTLLNVLSLFIEPNLKIVSIEDTAELQLPHVNWMPQVTRSGFGSTGYGEVGMYDLLKASLRQRPDYLIVGEVRGKEANVLFHAMSTGHAGLSTIHADNVGAVVDRLTTRPIDLSKSLLENLDIIIFLSKMKKEDRFIRRVNEIIEVERYNPVSTELETNTVFRWDPLADNFVGKDSYVLHDIAKNSGMTQQEVHEELSRRVKIFEWMQKNSIYRFNDVANLIHMYYIDPAKLGKMMGQKL